MTPSRTARPRLLFLCQTLPYPPNNGVQIRTYNVLRLLARAFDITALCFVRRADHRTPSAVAESVTALRRFGDIEAFPIPQEHRRARLLADHARSVATGAAYTLHAYESAAFRTALRHHLATTAFDLVHVDSMDLAGYLPSVAGLPVVCVHHNIESALLRRRGASRGGAIGAYIAHQGRLTERIERAWSPRVALNVLVSPADQLALERLAPGARSVVVPNGVDTSFFVPAEVPDAGDTIVFVGPATWAPNRDAMLHFCREILPRIHARGVTPTVTWIGRVSDADRAAFRDVPGLQLPGFVDDMRPLVQRSACYVAPLLAGGGTRLKILDAWGMGKAVVSTTVGCEGLDARDGENILVRDAPDEFADAVVSMMRDPAARARIGAAARRTAEQRYDWEAIGGPMLQAYDEVLSRPPRPGAHRR